LKLAFGMLGLALACGNSGPAGPAPNAGGGQGVHDAAVGGTQGGHTASGGSSTGATGGAGGKETGGMVAGRTGGNSSGGAGGDTGGSDTGGAGTGDTAGAVAGGAGGGDSGGNNTGGSGGGATGGRSAGGVDAAAGASALDAGSGAPDAPSVSGFLHVQGNRLLDAQGKSVRLTGVNWFGLETSNEAPHGTWARDYRSMLKQMRDLGFNSLRLPWSNAILRSDAKAASVTTVGKDPYDGTDPMNGPLAGKTPLEMMDLVIVAAGDVGLKIILDNHSREPEAYDKEELWFSAKTPESLWISDWVSLAKRYSGNTTVVAFDLDNEPHGASTWGTGSTATDWNSAAERCGNAIQAANPDVLIIVEGVSIVGTDTYWWGGNLSAVRTAPIHLTHPEKLVYSTHEYGPEVHDQTWFSDPTFPANLAKVWDQHFDFIMTQEIGHLLLGEFGIKDRSASSGKSGQWFDTLLKTVGSTYSWTFWCWNPNSGDTEGILQTDWLTPQQWKMDALKPYLAPMIGK
jgi:aryl-phospho-beta-D-glucosidase BglC (GH1 family)